MSENSDESLDEPRKNKFQYSDYFLRSFLRSKMRTINNITSSPMDKRPPWRTNSFAPNQLYRYNYLETDKDALEKRYLRLEHLDCVLVSRSACRGYRSIRLK
jgi:hypothetical protein